MDSSGFVHVLSSALTIQRVNKGPPYARINWAELHCLHDIESVSAMEASNFVILLLSTFQRRLSGFIVNFYPMKALALTMRHGSTGSLIVQLLNRGCERYGQQNRRRARRSH